MAFDKSQIRMFVRRTKAEAGPAWSMLGERFQRALIAEMALCVLGTQARETLPTDLLHKTLDVMLKEAGFEE